MINKYCFDNHRGLLANLLISTESAVYVTSTSPDVIKCRKFKHFVLMVVFLFLGLFLPTRTVGNRHYKQQTCTPTTPEVDKIFALSSPV